MVVTNAITVGEIDFQYITEMPQIRQHIYDCSFCVFHVLITGTQSACGNDLTIKDGILVG